MLPLTAAETYMHHRRGVMQLAASNFCAHICMPKRLTEALTVACTHRSAVLLDDRACIAPCSVEPSAAVQANIMREMQS